MLVISRRIGESFLIGDDIVATVVDITGGKVVLGLNAPKEVAIRRNEVLQIGELNAQAAAGGNINMNGFAKMYKKRFSGQKPK
ncbi:MAG: carbon storage regulator [Oscillospiraceae bacterium]|nr:carbon storage regulator [Oscillospiraceae bacterium]